MRLSNAKRATRQKSLSITAERATTSVKKTAANMRIITRTPKKIYPYSCVTTGKDALRILKKNTR